MSLIKSYLYSRTIIMLCIKGEDISFNINITNFFFNIADKLGDGMRGY